METKYIVWLIGSNSSGKTTQSRLLHKFFATGGMRVNNVSWPSGSHPKWTTFGRSISNLGVIQETDCCGADTISLKEDMVLSYKCACEETDIIVIDAIMATGSYIDFIRDVPYDTKVLLVHIKISQEANFQRVRGRRANKTEKDLSEVHLSLKTQENLSGKIRGFQSLFNRMKDLVELAIEVDGELSRNQINDQILCALNKII